MMETKGVTVKTEEMYTEWASINVSKILDENKWSILHKLPNINGQSVVNAVVKPLANNLSAASVVKPNVATTTSAGFTALAGSGDVDYNSYLKTDRDVQWVMEVICYGLSLPINTAEQHEAVRDSVAIYCEWMYSVVPPKCSSKLIPFPIKDEPNLYFRRMIYQLYNVFVPRTSTTVAGNMPNPDFNVSDLLSRQAVLCHRVLRTIQCIAEDENSTMDGESWEKLLIFLLSINDMLLSPPVEKDDIGTHLTERIVSALFDIWIIACQRYFPAPSFWKTLMQLCCTWRHRQSLVEQWSRVCLILTQRLMQLTYDSELRLSAFSSSQCVNAILQEMNYDTASQTWFRLLHLLGNPVELCSPEIISRTEKFYHYAAESVVDPRQHPCLNILPYNFYRAMRGLSSVIDTFLGVQSNETNDVEATKVVQNPASQPLTPPINRKGPSFKNINSFSKASHKANILSAFSSAPKTVQINSNAQTNHITYTPVQISCLHPTKVAFSPSRPKINSVLNVVGNWLFAACTVGTEASLSEGGTESVGDANRSTKPTSFGSNVEQNHVKKSSPVMNCDRISIEMSLSPENFEAGQAEAVGALCRLFSSKKTNEEILPVYLARFYLTLQRGLSSKEPFRSLFLSSILLNSTKLFQLNLNGVNILVPHFLKAMEIVIAEKDSKAKFPMASSVELRQACISILLSMLTYPLHFTNLPIKDCLIETPSVTTFQSLRSRLVNLMIVALQTENDSVNAQMLLAGFLVCVQDAAAYEAEEGFHQDSDSIKSKQSPFTSDTAMGLFARALYLVCHLLISNWKNDTQVSLAALEMLSGLARIRFGSNEYMSTVEECKKATKWICDYIVNQCSRPPPCHSKDMHSAIVAAYQCLAVWFHEHSYLLQDRECVSTLMEVIELGISGSKSKTKDKVFLKADKELKPASMRVSQAAESLQTFLMSHFGYCPTAPCPPEAIPGCCLVSESTIVKNLKLKTDVPDNPCKLFKHFVSGGSTIYSFINDTSDNRSLCIIRSPFGKYSWAFKYELVPQKSRMVPLEEVSRPPFCATVPSKSPHMLRHFPEMVDKAAFTKMDNIIPTLESVDVESEFKKNIEDLRKILNKQFSMEKDIQQKCVSSSVTTNCKQPPPLTEIDCSRLVLSHLGFMPYKSVGDMSAVNTIPSMTVLDAQHTDLANDLRSLDTISTRTSDTAFIFYVREGRYHPQEILNSVSSKHYVSSQFLNFLTSVGSPVNVSEHCGWTGKIYTSWKSRDEELSDINNYNVDHGGCAYDGQTMTLYWADISHELAFIVPSGRYLEEDSGSLELEKARVRSNDNDRRSLSSLSDDGTSASSQSRTYSDADSTRSSWRKKNKQLSQISNVGCDTKILIVWLENMEDEVHVPIASLLSTTDTGIESSLELHMEYIVIYIHPLKNGLYRIKVSGSSERISLCLPLIDGMVVSYRILGTVVRLTTLNICRRRRLDAESYQPPHVKRRLKIQHLAHKFRSQLNEPEFYNYLFS